MRNHKFSTAFATVYLLVYTLLFNLGVSFDVLSVMFLLSPFIVIWMAYTIIRYGKYDGRQLEENEEWGYQDRTRESFNKKGS